jgi:hypothetical protein
VRLVFEVVFAFSYSAAGVIYEAAAGRMHRNGFIVHMRKQRFLMEYLTSNACTTSFMRFANFLSNLSSPSHS